MSEVLIRKIVTKISYYQMKLFTDPWVNAPAVKGANHPGIFPNPFVMPKIVPKEYLKFVQYQYVYSLWYLFDQELWWQYLFRIEHYLPA